MKSINFFRVFLAGLSITAIIGCSTPGEYHKKIDKNVYRIIEQKQQETLGKTEPFTIETPEETLRRRLLIDQKLPYSGKESLGVTELKPVDHWPKGEPVPSSATSSISFATSITPDAPLHVNLETVLQIAAHSSRQYQSMKENVFRAALDLNLQKQRFQNTFTGQAENLISTDLSGNDTVSGDDSGAILGLSRKFLNGISLTTRIGLDLTKLLSPNDHASGSLYTDSSIMIPLLRGAGKHIVAEPLTQAERNVVYAIYDFERYKRSFAVDIAKNYLSVLQQFDQVKNSEENYRGLITSGRRARRLAEAGNLSPIQVDQSIQNELSARNRWIGTQISLQRGLDSFKILLGLPTDAKIEMDREDLSRLTKSAEAISAQGIVKGATEVIPPADAPVILPEISNSTKGSYEFDEKEAIQIAFANRLDLRNSLSQVYDAQRKVVVAADALRPELTFLGKASAGEGRSIGSANQPNNFDLNFEKGRYNALLTLDLPFDRKEEAVNYRERIIALEKSVRDYQNLEDTIKQDVRNKLRDLLEARESLLIQAQAVEVAKRRVISTNLYLQAGRVQIRDLLESQEALLSTQNAFTSALIDYRMAELEIQRDLDVLQVDENGLWKEFSPKELNHE